MKTTDQTKQQPMKGELAVFTDNVLQTSQMLMVKGGADEDPPQGDDDQDDGFN